MNDSNQPSRQKPAHGIRITSNAPTIVFLTVCTKDRIKILDNDSTHNLLVKIWRDSDAWLAGRYVLMPDHIHLFASPNGEKSSLEMWVRYWKSIFTRQRDGESIWQDGHWDRRLRSSESYEQKWEYVRSNPVRHGFVGRWQDWKYQGEIHELYWM